MPNCQLWQLTDAATSELCSGRSTTIPGAPMMGPTWKAPTWKTWIGSSRAPALDAYRGRGPACPAHFRELAPPLWSRLQSSILFCAPGFAVLGHVLFRLTLGPHQNDWCPPLSGQLIVRLGPRQHSWYSSLFGGFVLCLSRLAIPPRRFSCHDEREKVDGVFHEGVLAHLDLSERGCCWRKGNFRFSHSTCTSSQPLN